MRTFLAGGVAAAGLLWALAQPAAAAQGQDCAALAGLKIENTNLLSATVVPAADGLPSYCRVLGYVRPAINFEVRLPVEDWNGKFYMAGCGGLCGTLDSDRPGFINAINYALKRGYAVSANDSGHWGSSITDGRWAMSNPAAEADWGYRSTHEGQRVTKDLIAAFYGEAPKHSYFQGCSTGGRQASMEAWRYPDDFDGIINGAPALDYTGLVGTAFAHLVRANTDADGKDIFPPAKAGLVHQAVLKSCDGKDGLEDGLISDARLCDWDPAELQCEGDDKASCLTEDEVGVLKAWYSPATNSDGEALYPGGLPQGSEPYWWLWLTGNGKGAGRLIPAFNTQFLRYMAFPDDPGAAFGTADFEFDYDPDEMAPMGEIYNSDNPDLARFRQSGGKMLMWHGWADSIVTPFKTVDYYEKVMQTNGGREQAQGFVRLFMIPGADHCGILSGGDGIDQSGLDPLSALEAWVEEGKAPETLLMTKRDKEGKTLWTRPSCPYPQVARYSGQGPTTDAANFTCAEP